MVALTEMSEQVRNKVIRRIVNTPFLKHREWWGIWESTYNETCIGIFENISEVAKRLGVEENYIFVSRTRCKVFNRKKFKKDIYGIYWSEEVGKWYAKGIKDGKNEYLGYFSDKKDAITARKNFEKENQSASLRTYPDYSCEVSDDIFSETWQCGGYVVSRFVEVS